MARMASMQNRGDWLCSRKFNNRRHENPQRSDRGAWLSTAQKTSKLPNEPIQKSHTSASSKVYRYEPRITNKLCHAPLGSCVSRNFGSFLRVWPCPASKISHDAPQRIR